jgi:hypothetical protein
VEADAVVSRARGPTGFELAGGGVGLTGARGAGAQRRRVALGGAAREHGLRRGTLLRRSKAARSTGMEVSGRPAEGRLG